MWVKESITAFFPVPLAHHRVKRCDIAWEKLLGTIGDLLDVSIALEETSSQSTWSSRSLRIVLLSLMIIYILELFFLLVWLGIDPRAA